MTIVDVGAAGPLAAIAIPLVVAAGVLVRALRPAMLSIGPWTALPALLVATGLLGTSELHARIVLLGMRLGMPDTIARELLLLTSCVWLASGLFAKYYMASDPHRARFWSFFLVTSSANLGVVLAQDVASFYFFYALMTFASYGLIAHTRTGDARRAGLVYLVLALIGEMLLLTAFFLIVGGGVNLALVDVPQVVAVAPGRELIVALVLVGFGVKAGALVLHVWLPLAHPVAPTPASAVLSGALIKAGLLAWLRFLPLGLVALPTPGLVCVIAGLVAAFYGVGVGLTQRDPKTILAYSSVSQMGFVTAMLGVALAVPAVTPAAIAAILFYALHHAVVKGALFLGTGVVSAAHSDRLRRLALLVLSVPALALAGAPLSSGALAKLTMKDVMVMAPWDSVPFEVLLALGSVATTVLMAHFLVAVSRRASEHAGANLGLWAPWLALVLVGLFVVARPLAGFASLVQIDHVWAALWPVIAGIATFVLARRVNIRSSPVIPAGDVLVLFELAVGWSRRLVSDLAQHAQRTGAGVVASLRRVIDGKRLARAVLRSIEDTEGVLGRFSTVGIVLALFAVISILLASLGGSS